MLTVVLSCLGPVLAAQSAPSMTPLWSYATGGELLSSPALGSNDTVYAGSYDQYLYAIDSTNGQLRWRFSVEPTRNNECAYILSSPAIAADGTIYFGTDHQLSGNGGSVGEFYALNPNGTLKWRYLVNAAIYSDPAIGADGTVYFGRYDTDLYALNPNGTLKWKFLAGEQIYSDPIVGPDGVIYFGADNGRLYALNTNGTLRWSFNTGRVITGSPAMGAGDRATEFKQRCDGLEIKGVSLHSYRYAWAERALKCGYPERFAQQALGHNSKAIHAAYSRNAEVTVPSLDDWEKQWKENPQKINKPAVVQVDFVSPTPTVSNTESEVDRAAARMG